MPPDVGFRKKQPALGSRFRSFMLREGIAMCAQLDFMFKAGLGWTRTLQAGVRIPMSLGRTGAAR